MQGDNLSRHQGNLNSQTREEQRNDQPIHRHSVPAIGEIHEEPPKSPVVPRGKPGDIEYTGPPVNRPPLFNAHHKPSKVQKIGINFANKAVVSLHG